MARTHSSNIVQAIEDGTFFVEDETPVGSINGSNKTFTLADSPNPTDSLEVHLNGVTLTLTFFTPKGSSIDFTTYGNTGLPGSNTK